MMVEDLLERFQTLENMHDIKYEYKPAYFPTTSSVGGVGICASRTAARIF
jgi:hypothetical protein